MSVEITLDELLADLERFPAKQRGEPFTEVQMQAIEAARKRLSWLETAEWFNAKFGTAYTGHQMSGKYHAQVGKS